MQQVYQISGESFEDIIGKMTKIVDAFRGTAPKSALAPTPIEKHIEEASRAAPEPKRRGRPPKADAPKADAPKAPAPVAESASAATPVAPEVGDKSLTAADAREAAKLLIAKSGVAAVQTILASFDADRVGALAPEHYAQFIADCRTMAGAKA